MLNIIESGWLISLLRRNNISVGMLFGPIAFLGFSEEIIFSISLLSQSKMANELLKGLFR